MKSWSLGRIVLALALLAAPAWANVPGGGTGTGPNVTLVDNGGTVTLANGIVSILCTKSGATINQINYTYNNGSGTQTTQVLAGGNNGGQLYWELGGFGTGSFTYSLVSDPAGNGGAYAEISLLSTSATAGTMEVHFSLPRGATGFYVTAIWAHRGVDAAMGMGETRDNIYSGSIFNWMSVDAARNRLMEVPSGSSIGVFNAPVEVSLWTSGLYAGQYEDKYCYSADLGVQRAWGWSSVGAGGKNIGLWNVSASAEYYNGGPTKRELMCHIGTTILNMHNGSHYGGGTDSSFAAGELWTKVYGPYLIYCNNATNTITDPTQASGALYADAMAQAAAEQTAWPYNWFANANYTPASGRGTVTGTMAIADSGNPNASAGGLWVGVVQQPSTTAGVYDFQKWMKPYQFWVKSDTNGNFTIPGVIAGANYTLYAFGPGAAGTFQSQALSGGAAPNTLDIPASPFAVTVAGGATNNLGTVTWTPTRVGPTVFEIGYPDRTAAKFRHGDDYWVGDVGPSASTPSPIWSKHLAFPLEFPTGPHYTVGQNRWSTDWDYVQPVLFNSAGNFATSTSTINFNLPSAPTLQGSFYIALASDYQGPLIIQVNGNNITGVSGYGPSYNSSSGGSDTTIRQGIHGCYSDCRTNVPVAYLHQGLNTMTITMRKADYFANHAMYDYLRLELAGYVPPAPASVAAYPGNNSVLVSWPVTPGATSYNLLRSTTSGNGYAPITNGLTGPVCGSGPANGTFLDTTALNGTTYYYVVASVNPVGASGNSPESSGVAPSAAVATTPPAAPTGVLATPGDASVSLGWNPTPGANCYTVQRSTLVNNGAGSFVTLSTITLNNNITGTSFTDTTPYNGTTYNYFVSATSAGGAGSNSAPVAARPLPAAPTSAPGSLAGVVSQYTNITLNWLPVSGAVGYVVQSATSSGGPFALLDSITETTYTDFALASNSTNYYRVTTVNAAGASTNSATSVITPPAAPATLAAIPGNTIVTLTWPAPAGATSYILKRGLTSNNIATVVVSGYAGTSYTDTNLVNGTQYFYVVAATGAGGLGPNSPVSSATPTTAVAAGLVWSGATSTAWDTTTTNWLNGATPSLYVDGNNVSFNSSPVSTTVAVAGAVFPGSVAFANSSVSYTVSASGAGISGSTSLVKSNAGTVTFTSANGYSGGTALSGGILTLNGANGSAAFTGALGSGTVTLNSGGELLLAPPGGTAGRTSSTFTNSFVLNGGLLYANDGQEHLTGALAVTASTTLLRQWDNKTADQVKGLLLDGVLSGSAALNLFGTAGSVSEGARLWIDNANNTYNGMVTVNASSALSGFTAPAGGFGLGLGANTALQFATLDVEGARPGGSTDAGQLYGLQFLGGVTAPVLGALAGNGNINLDTFGTVTAVALTVGGNNANTAFSGVLSSTTGNGSLIKMGLGAMTLSGANTYSGGTTVSNGTLLVNNTTGSGTGSGAVTVAGGMLSGTGIISAAVTVNSGGALAPGNPLGTLTLSNALTLAAGSTTFVQVQHSPLTNDAVSVGAGLTEGGTLNVTNIGLSAFTPGDSFKLFSAAGYAGSFSIYVLPALNPGSVWNTNLLNVSGTLTVAAYLPPTISNLAVAGGNVIISGSSGIPGWTYYVLGTTNLAAPPGQWASLATNQFDLSGNFALTNAVNPVWPQAFFRLQLR